MLQSVKSPHGKLELDLRQARLAREAAISRGDTSSASDLTTRIDQLIDQLRSLLDEQRRSRAAS